MDADNYERVLCVKNEVLVFKIPPRPSNRGYRAADWNLDKHDWSGRLRVVVIGQKLSIKLEDKSGELFAECPIEEYPSVAVEPVIDSSRYFVIRIKDPSGRSAFIGIGFLDRGDSFDLNVALQDHFKHKKQEEEFEKSAKELEKQPKLDLSFKEGQTITINIGNKKSDSARSRPKGSIGSTAGMLPPPPGGMKIKPPPSQIASKDTETLIQPAMASQIVPQLEQRGTVEPTQQKTPNVDLLFSLDSDPPLQPPVVQPQKCDQTAWADFTSYTDTMKKMSDSNNDFSDDWMKF